MIIFIDKFRKIMSLQIIKFVAIAQSYKQEKYNISSIFAEKYEISRKKNNCLNNFPDEDFPERCQEWDRIFSNGIF